MQEKLEKVIFAIHFLAQIYIVLRKWGYVSQSMKEMGGLVSLFITWI